MIHQLPIEFTFEEPVQFTDPFRYTPHPSVKEAARRVIKRIDSDPTLASAFSEGKMLGVLVCRSHNTETSHTNVIARREAKRQSLYYIAAFSGNVGGQSQIEGFVPPIFDLTDPDGEFKRREAEITELNHKIEDLLDSDRLLCLERELSDAVHGSKSELTSMKEGMAVSKARREQVRKSCTDPEVLQELIKESQYEKAEYRRLKKVLDEFVDRVKRRVEQFHNDIESLKKQRASMSESLQDWIFRQYIVHKSSGESASIAEIFAHKGLVPPGGTGECAAPKLLEYAYRNGLEPLAMGEFWYGRSPEAAVRTHGHFYPSCTSKCGPLLGYMLRGISSLSSGHTAEGQNEPARRNEPVASQNEPETPIIIYEDDAVIVVEKPSGMPSVPGLDGRQSLLEWLSSPLSNTQSISSSPSKQNIAVMSSEQSASRHPHAVHRLDMDTSGIMVFAKTHEAAVNLRGQFEHHTIRKTYIARVSAPEVGQTTKQEHPPIAQSQESFRYPTAQTGNTGTIDLPLSPDYDERPRQKVDFKQGKDAYTEYEVIKENPDGTADLLLYPHTGRTHQLRVHCAHTLGLGRPILGDLLYGAHSIYDSKSNITWQSGKQQGGFTEPHHPTRLHLHALSITFIHPLTAEPLTFTSNQLCY